MDKLNKTIIDINKILKFKEIKYKYAREALFRNFKKAKKNAKVSVIHKVSGKYEEEYNIPSLYKQYYQDWYEIVEIMNFFDLDKDNSREMLLAIKFVYSIGITNTPIFGIGTNYLISWKNINPKSSFVKWYYQYKIIENGWGINYYYLLRFKMKKEFAFVDKLFEWSRKHYPDQSKRALLQLEKNKNVDFFYNDINETKKAIKLFKEASYNINKINEVKCHQLCELLLPFKLPEESKKILSQIIKINQSKYI